MKVVVIGGTGLIGTKLVGKLEAHGHEAVAAAPATGVDTFTGEGLAEVLDGAQVVVDVSNAPSFADADVMKFFETTTTNILSAAATAGVQHHVALSVVGTERLQESGYFRAKLVQERLIAESGLPYSIVRATQFHEFIMRIVDSATVDNVVRMAPVLFQPIAADEVAQAVGKTAVGAPVNGIVEIAGPEQFRLDELVRQTLAARGDPRQVVTDPEARYFNAKLSERSIVPDAGARLGVIRVADWAEQAAAAAAVAGA
jgi:uncharacterized protein YbjT (DUF2867 family)